MAFWGMSKEGKAAKKAQEELAAWNRQQAEGLTADMGRYGRTGDEYTGAAADYWRNAINSGLAPVSDIRGTGEEIMPIDDVIRDRWGRLNQISQDFNALPGAAATMGEVRGNLDQQGRNITENRDAINDMILDRTRRDIDIEQSQNQGFVDNLKGAFGSMRGNAVTDYDGMTGQTGAMYSGLRGDAGGTYGGLRGDNATTFKGLQNSSDATYAEANQAAEMLRPGSEFNVARTARAFAPQMAATMGRLRRAGIDPSSPQAAAMISRVETGRARAMDDASADGAARYFDAKTGLLLNQQADKERMGLGRLDRESSLVRESGEVDRGLAERGNEMNVNLGREKSGIVRDLDMGQTDRFLDEGRRMADAMRGINQDYQNSRIANTQAAFGQNQDLLDARTRASLMDRDLGREDWQTKADLGREQNAEASYGLGLRNEQFDRGMGWQQANMDQRNQAAGQMGALGQLQYGNQWNAARAAQGFGGAATNAYDNIYQREAANAGWGKKLLAGAATAGLNMVAPGLGTAVGSAMGGNFQPAANMAQSAWNNKQSYKTAMAPMPSATQKWASMIPGWGG